jgi:Mce-associated membrane protein
VALAGRRNRTTVRRRVGPPSTVDEDFLPGPDPLEPEESAPPEPVRRIVRRPRPRPRPRSVPTETAAPEPEQRTESKPPKESRQRKESKAGREPGSRRAVWVTRVTALALVAALTATGLLARQWYDQRQLDTARQQALAAARQEVTDFVSISASTVDSDLARIAAGASGDFKDEFTRDMPQVRAAVVQNKVDSKGTVLRAAVVSSDRHTATVLVAVDATVKNASAPDGRLSHYRIQVSVTRDGSGRWLISALQFVG